MAMDVGHGYGPFSNGEEATVPKDDSEFFIQKKPGYLFDCVDICINEGQKYCLLGDNASGKSTLLRLLAKREEPLEGSVQYANNVQIGYFGQETMDDLLKVAHAGSGVTTALSYLQQRFPKKTEKELRRTLAIYLASLIT